MTLNAEQREGTRRELQQNLALSGMSRDEAAARLGWSATRFEATIAITPESDPVDVWLLRDALENAVRALELAPVRYSVLTEDARSSAQKWFGLSIPNRRKSDD